MLEREVLTALSRVHVALHVVRNLNDTSPTKYIAVDDVPTTATKIMELKEFEEHQFQLVLFCF